MFEGGGQVCSNVQKVGIQMLLLVLLLPLAPPWKMSFSSSTEASGATAGQSAGVHTRAGDWHPVTPWLQTCV